MSRDLNEKKSHDTRQAGLGGCSAPTIPIPQKAPAPMKYPNHENYIPEEYTDSLVDYNDMKTDAAGIPILPKPPHRRQKETFIDERLSRTDDELKEDIQNGLISEIGKIENSETKKPNLLVNILGAVLIILNEFSETISRIQRNLISERTSTSKTPIDPSTKKEKALLDWYVHMSEYEGDNFDLEKLIWVLSVNHSKEYGRKLPISILKYLRKIHAYMNVHPELLKKMQNKLYSTP